MATGIQLQPPPRRQRDDYDRREQLAQAMMMQATDASPKGHWLAAVAQALQGYMGGRNLRQAQNDRQDAATQQVKTQNSERDALIGALTGQFRDPNAPAAHEVPIPGAFGTSPMQELPQMDNRPQMPGFAQALLNSGSPGAQNLAIQQLATQLMGGGDPYTLGPGEVRYGPNNQVLARGPERTGPQPRQSNDIINYRYAVENDGYGGTLQDWIAAGRPQRQQPRTDAQRRRDLYEGNVVRSAVAAYPGDPAAQLQEINTAMEEYDRANGGGAPANVPQQAPANMPAPPSNAPPQRVEAPTPEQQSPEQIGGMAPPADAYGFVSNVVNAINTVTDFLGAGQVGESTALARRDADRLATDTVLTLERAVPGRPTNYLLQMLERYASRPGGFSGPEGALKSMEATRDAIQFMINDISTIETRGLTATQRGELSETLTQLENLQGRYNTMVENFYTGIERGQSGGGVVRPANVPADVWAAMTQQERRDFVNGGRN